MQINPADLIIHIINVVVLFIILRFVLFKPVSKYLNNRSDGIKKDLEDADKTKKEAEEEKQVYDDKLAAVETDCEKLANDKSTKASMQSEKIISDAKLQAQAIIDKARNESQAEKEKKIAEMKDQIADLSVSIASKVLEREVSLDDNRAIIDKFIEEKTASDKAENSRGDQG